ncbi:MAG TPA: hypothetical protein VLB87_05905 [Pyrinomonadaceae bacterium]|nr:hypothetical protein [Pyrinomonadaceae bacterium]
MKTLLLLLLAFTPFVQRQPARQMLYDFRNERTSRPQKISPAIQRDVLSKVFRRYLTDPNRCKAEFDAGEDYLAGARRAGQIVPDVAQVVNGSFTAAGQTETAYLIFVNECNASHADNYGSKRLAIFSGPRLVADLDLDFKSGIVLTTDLDKDGINELMMTSGDMHQGELIEMAALLSFQNGRMRVVQDFGTVVEDNCASLRPGSAAKAKVLYLANAAPGQMPRITVSHFAAGCGNVRRWRPARSF